jgi:hypothetical protein
MSEKWGRRLFKTGAVVLLLLGAVHSLSLLEKPVPANPTEKQLLDLMASYHFNLMGSSRSMSDLLRGFSLSFMVSVIGFGVLDLALSRERSGLLKRLASINTIWLAAMTAITLKCFFAAATSFLVVTLLLFALAWWKLPADSAN